MARFVNNSNRDKQTAMHIACDRSFCDGVKILMSYKVHSVIPEYQYFTVLL